MDDSAAHGTHSLSIEQRAGRLTDGLSGLAASCVVDPPLTLFHNEHTLAGKQQTSRRTCLAVIATLGRPTLSVRSPFLSFSSFVSLVVSFVPSIPPLFRKESTVHLLPHIPHILHIPHTHRTFFLSCLPLVDSQPILRTSTHRVLFR